jgi:hypothetical protein
VTSIVNGVVFASERESGHWIDCSTCSAAMAAHWHDPSVAATLATAHAIRSAVPLPHSGGLTPAQVKTGLQKALHVTADSISKADIPTRLAHNYGIIVPLNAGSLPAHLRRWQPSFAGGHSVFMCGRNSAGKFGWFDPLAPAGYSGEWVNWSDVDQAIWSSGALCLPKYVAPARPAPAPAPAQPTNTLRYGGKSEGRGQYVVSADGVRIREKPYTNARIVKTVNHGTTFRCGQTTDTGTSVNGSRRWRGTADGRKWVHDSLVRAHGHSTGRETVR